MAETNDPDKKDGEPSVPTASVYERLYTYGFPGTIDRDPGEDLLLSKVAREYEAASIAAKVNRATLYYDWRPHLVPNVTLEQGAWLLMGIDPRLPHARRLWNGEITERHYHELLNRLECEVAENELKPVGKHVEGVVRRYRLADVAKVAARRKFSESTAEEIQSTSVHSRAREGASALRPETQAINRRRDVHRLLVAQFADEAESIPPVIRKRNVPDRQTECEPLNKKLSLSILAYNDLFRQLHSERFPLAPRLDVADSTLKRDRRELNIQLPPGRPKGSGRKAKQPLPVA